MTLVTMSKQEFSRVAVLQDLQADHVEIDEAAISPSDQIM